ncbi:YczE/YyaS/YitT family protein [Liberiplasma polymorphum]|uniref:YczE/YyaS/YitT family protein n=1 Tax=Liberiplasma polymorphum TaxID=3374570 RepID=UPI0037721665
MSKAINITLYFLGFLIIGLGVILVIKSNFGAGPWDTTTYNLSHLLGITIGTASALINGTILAVVIIYNKKLKYFFILVPIFSVAISIDFWDLIVFDNFIVINIFYRTLLFIIGVFVLTFGLALVYVTRYPAMIFEEFTFVLMKLLRINSFLVTRIIIESLAITLAIIFGFMASIGFGQVNYGSVLLAITIGPIIAFQIKWLSKIRSHFESDPNTLN